MNEYLRQFNGDYHTKELVKQFILDFINQEALNKMYAKQDVSHISDAVELLNKSFEELENIYGIKQQPADKTNQAI
jgi:hypothetical protein